MILDSDKKALPTPPHRDTISDDFPQRSRSITKRISGHSLGGRFCRLACPIGERSHGSDMERVGGECDGRMESKPSDCGCNRSGDNHRSTDHCLNAIENDTERLEKRMDKQDETIRQQGEMFYNALERLEERMDKRFVEVNHRFDEVNHRFDEVNQRFVEVNQRIGETNQRIDGLRSEMNQQGESLRSEMNQRFSEMNGEISDVRSEMRQLNQNHIEHLNRHHSQ